MRRLTVFLLVFLLLSTFAYAHPGSTNGDGGHMDRSTGEYHYHHGYSAHSHDGGVCPYDYDDQTGSTSGYSSGGGFSSSPLYYRTTANVNMRSSASSSSSIIQTIPSGKRVKYASGYSGNWIRVSYSGKTGWVYGEYLVKYKTVATVRPTAKPTVQPTATPKPTQPVRKELLPMTFTNILLFIGIGFALGLVILFIYRRNVNDREDKMRQNAHKQANEAFASGKQATLDTLRDFKTQLDKWQKELCENELSFRKKEAAFLEEASRLKEELPPMESIVNVKIADGYYYRSLYHRTDSSCLKYGKTVTLQTARELYLRPCKVCKPDEQVFLTPPSPTAQSKWDIVSLEKYLEQKKQDEDIHISYRN